MMHHTVSRFEPLMAKLSTKYEGAEGLHAMHRWASGKNCSIEREEEITAKKDVPLVAKERLEEVDFRSNP